MRKFGTQGPVNAHDNYIVSRAQEMTDFIARVKAGKYIVIFAPRQTGKTTFFQQALNVLNTQEDIYFPIELNVETYIGLTSSDFYSGFPEDVQEAIESVFQRRGSAPPPELTRFLENTTLIHAVSTRRFFRHLAGFLEPQRVVLIIDEFDGIPREAVNGFLHALRHIYITKSVPRCPYSVGIVGVKNIRQLNYDASISPFNIQDELVLPNFTLEQVRELLEQYTDEVGQGFAPNVIKTLHKQTAGHPFLVNRAAQILTEELDIPKTETITMAHFAKAHRQLLEEGNTNIDHLTTNIRKDRRFETLLMRIASYDQGLVFNPDDVLMNELLTYGVITQGTDGLCEIVNPIYQHRILQTFKPTVNGLELEYLPEDTDFMDYLTPEGELEMKSLLDNFQDFIARAGFRILQVPDTPQEYVGQHLLYAYLYQFVRVVQGEMFLEGQTGRGRIDLLILHASRKYIVETKVWEGERSYQAGKRQLAAYLKLEGTVEGYYVVFDHRKQPEPRVETEVMDAVKIRSYVIPVIQAPRQGHPNFSMQTLYLLKDAS